MRVVKGTLVPSPTVIREMIKTLQGDLKRDRKLAATFKRDPRRVLGDRGFPRDLQVEILREMGRRVAADCGLTCVSTDTCCCETL